MGQLIFLSVPDRHLLVKRIPDPGQSDEGPPVPGARYADRQGAERRRDRERQHGHGFRAHRPPPGRRAGDDHLPLLGGGDTGVH